MNGNLHSRPAVLTGTLVSTIACVGLVGIATGRAQGGAPAYAREIRGGVSDAAHIIIIRDAASVPLGNAAVQLGDRPVEHANFDGIVIVDRFQGMRYPLKLQVRAPGFHPFTSLIDQTRQRIEVFLDRQTNRAGLKVVSVSELSPEVRAEVAHLYKAALAAVEKGELPAADLLLRQAHEKLPSATGIHEGLAIIALQQGRTDDAARWLEEALVLSPFSSKLIGDLGTVRFFQKRRQESYRLLSRAVERGYDRPGAHYRLGLLAFGKGRWKEASKELKRSNADRFRYRDLFLSQALRRLGKTREAGEAFVRFVARNPAPFFITRWTGPLEGR